MSVKPDQDWPRRVIDMDEERATMATGIRNHGQATYWKDIATNLGRILRAERLDYAKLEKKLAFYMIVSTLGWGALVMALVNGWGV